MNYPFSCPSTAKFLLGKINVQNYFSPILWQEKKERSENQLTRSGKAEASEKLWRMDQASIHKDGIRNDIHRVENNMKKG